MGSDKPADTLAAERVLQHVEHLIESHQLGPGERLPGERELARRVGVSRPSVRSGLSFLAALGVVESRHGAGTFITAGPPRLSATPLSFIAALHGFTSDEVFEARRVLEVEVAGLAAERATEDSVHVMDEEVTSMFASLQDPHNFLLHDVRFHRAVAAGSQNAVLAALVEMVSAVVYGHRRLTVDRAGDLGAAAESHRRIWVAIRERDPERARAEMSSHIDLARRVQALESTRVGPLPASGGENMAPS